VGAINYTRSRLKIVYPFNGHDTSKSEVKTVPAQTVALSDKIEFVESPEYQFELNAGSGDQTAKETSDISFADIFKDASKGAPNVFVIDTSGSLPQLGNLFVSAVTTGSVTVAQSNVEVGSFGALALVVL